MANITIEKELRLNQGRFHFLTILEYECHLLLLKLKMNRRRSVLEIINLSVIMMLVNNKAVFKMSVNREELKQLIDFIHEEDTAEVYDFIGYLNMKRERETIDQMDLDLFSKDKELIRQVEKSRDDRANGRIYDEEQGLTYLQNKIKEFESEQNL